MKWEEAGGGEKNGVANSDEAQLCGPSFESEARWKELGCGPSLHL